MGPKSSSGGSFNTSVDSSSCYSRDHLNSEIYQRNAYQMIDLLKRKRLNHSNFEDSENSFGLEDESSSSKKPMLEYNFFEKSRRITKEMVYEQNKGLVQGILKPLSASKQKEKRGLGLRLDTLDAAVLKFDSNLESVRLEEHIQWLHSTTNDLNELTRDELDSWLKIGRRKLTIDDEDKFCDPKVLNDILQSKAIFDQIDRAKLKRARTRCNPFETIRASIFLNRAAVKMANMDAVLNFVFTDPKDENGLPLVPKNDLLYFADVCAGPGGFSEYVLWRKKWQAKGFGFTLRNKDDFKLEEFLAGNAETFDAYYGVKEDGNVCDPENIESLQRYVLSQTQNIGVHFMMADGGFSVDKKNLQEIESKQLYLCQCLVALSIVRERGSFVVKLFDIFTPFSVGLIYLMFKCFQQICILKPNTSRPANSERYLVCKYKKAKTDTIQRYLFDINQGMWHDPQSNADTLELVSYNVLREDQQFFNYILESNNRIGRNQVVGLLKIAAYSENGNLNEPRQAKIRKDCLNAWKLPSMQRKSKVKPEIYTTFKQLMENWFEQKNFLFANEKPLMVQSNELPSQSLSRIFRDKSDWCFVPIDTIEECGKNIRTFFMSLGGRDVFSYSSNGTWKPLQNIVLEMSANTLVYGEIVKELTGEWKSQTTGYGFHIIDGMVLGGINIRQLPLKERLKMCEKFANSLNKPIKVINDGFNKIATSQISCKKFYQIGDLRQFFDRLSHYTMKDGKQKLGFEIRSAVGPDRFYVPRGLLFFNDMKPNIQRAFSKTHQKIYFVDTSTGHTFFQNQIKDPNAIYASFRTTFVNRYLWEWKIEHQVLEKLNDCQKCNLLLYRVDLDKYIYQEH